ncbi:hypothetical protein Tco_0690651 [Tanacetum coccineum]
MTHLVASLTLDSANSCVMQGASCTQRKVSMVPFVFSIPFVLSWGGSINSDSFLPSILLLVVIIIMVVNVVVILIVIIVVIVGVVIVVVIIGVVVVVSGVSSILKLSHLWSLVYLPELCFIPTPSTSGLCQVVIMLACSIPIGWAYAFHQDKASLVRVPIANVTLSSLAHLLRENTDTYFAMVAVVVPSRAANTHHNHCRWHPEQVGVQMLTCDFEALVCVCGNESDGAGSEVVMP